MTTRAIPLVLLLASCNGCPPTPAQDQDAGSGDAHTSSSHTNTVSTSALATSSVTSLALSSSVSGATSSVGSGTSTAVVSGTSSFSVTSQGGSSAGISSSSAGSTSAQALSSSVSAASSTATSQALQPSSAAPSSSAPAGPVTGGPCRASSNGSTAIRVTFVDGGGTAHVRYDAFGLPDASRQHVGVFGYQIGFTPQYVDPFLAQGGVQLDGSDFVDVELSTAGLTSVDAATLSLLGRSYNTTTPGSFNWMTFAGSDATPPDVVANSAPYEWYSADITPVLNAGDSAVLMRIKAGPSSGSLVVSSLEICVAAH